MDPRSVPRVSDAVKLTIYWDNGTIETFHTRRSSIEGHGNHGFTISDAGVVRAFNGQYIRRVDTVDE